MKHGEWIAIGFGAVAAALPQAAPTLFDELAWPVTFIGLAIVAIAVLSWVLSRSRVLRRWPWMLKLPFVKAITPEPPRAPEAPRAGVVVADDCEDIQIETSHGYGVRAVADLKRTKNVRIKGSSVNDDPKEP